MASATDADGFVQRVTFLRDDVVVGEVIQPPFSLRLAGLAPGTYQFSARATDDRGATAVSPPVALTVNQAPAVALTLPASGAIFDDPASVTLAADAADADGRVLQVEFLQAGLEAGHGYDFSVHDDVGWRRAGSL
jgi:hypothetical protein